MQLDAEEDGEPFFKPQQPNIALPASSKQKEHDEGEDRAMNEQSNSKGEDNSPGETSQAAASAVTAEQEE